MRQSRKIGPLAQFWSATLASTWRRQVNTCVLKKIESWEGGEGGGCLTLSPLDYSDNDRDHGSSYERARGLAVSVGSVVADWVKICCEVLRLRFELHHCRLYSKGKNIIPVIGILLPGEQ
jgi:hypothetical protein